MSNKALNQTSREKEFSDAASKKIQGVIDAAGSIDLWHTPSGESWVTFAAETRKVNSIVKGLEFSDWLLRQYTIKPDKMVGKTVLENAISMLASKAKFEGKEHEIHLRVAGSLDDEIVVDLCDESGNYVKISKDRIEITKTTAYKFKRSQGMLALPYPDESGCIDDLRKWVNCQSEDDWILLLVCMVAALCPTGPFPILVFSGPPGSAKSTTAKLIRDLLDPNAIPLSRLSKNPRDLTAAVNNSRVLVYDNISKLSNEQSDDFCMIASGTGIRVRALNTTADEMFIGGGKFIILTGIGDYGTRSDFMNRSVLINLEPPSERRTENLKLNGKEGLLSEFKGKRPKLFGALLDILRATMVHYQAGLITLTGSPRMMDFAVLGNAVGMAMGWPPGEFDRAYNGNRVDADEVALEDSVLWEPLRKFLPNGAEAWEGSTTDLKGELKIVMEGDEKAKKIGLMQSSTVGQHLQRMAPLLRKMEWVATRRRSGSRGRIWILKPPS